MGDRTYVNLTVQLCHKAQVSEIAESNYADPDDVSDGEQCCVLGFNDVNYGELPFLDALQASGIAYDSAWDAGSDYGAGTSSCRYNEAGEIEVKTVYVSGENPPLEELLQRIDDPAALKQYILLHQENITSLPWLHQEEYGKRYRTKKLIQPREAA